VRLRRIDIRRLPGIAEPFSVELDPGINLVVGPNGSGKTSLCRAARALLWTEESPHPLFSAAADWERGGADWHAERDGTEAPRWEREGQPAEAPAIPGPQTAELYSLGVVDLLKRGPEAADHQLAEDVLTRLAGGYNVDRLLRDEFAERARAGNKERLELRRARREVEAVRRRHTALAHREDELDDLEQDLAESRRARNRLAVWQRGIALIAARREIERAESARTGFPPALAAATGDEEERLTTIANDLREVAETDAQTGQALEQARDQARKNALPNGPLPRAEMDAAWRRLELLQDRSRASIDAIREREAAAARLAEAGRALDPQWRAEDAGPVPPDAVTGAEEHLRVTQAAGVKADQLGVLLAHQALQEEPDRDDDAALHRGVELLESWLATRATGESIVLFALGLAGALAATAAGYWIATTTGALWSWIAGGFGTVVALALMVARIGWHRSGGLRRAALAREFATLPLDPPTRWRRQTVRETLTALREKEASRARAAVVRELRRLLEAERESSSKEHRRREAALPDLARELGAAPGLGVVELVEYGRRVLEYQRLRQEEAATVALAEQSERELADQLARLTEFLTRHGMKRPDGAIEARSLLEELDARSDELRDGLREAEREQSHLDDLQRRRENLERERAALFRRLGCAPDGIAEMTRRLRLIPAYQEARRALDESRVRRDERRRELQRVATAADLDATETEGLDVMELDEAIDRDEPLAARYDLLVEEVAQARTDIAAARGGTGLEAARADLELALAALAASCEEHAEADLARLLLTEVQTEHDRRFAPALVERADDLLVAFTRGRYRLIRPTRGTAEPTFRARDTETGASLALEELSDGTRAQLLLAARLAYLAETEPADPLPLFLDEALTASDPVRFAAVVDSLIVLAREQDRQIVYLTCDPADAAAWQRALTRADEPPAREIDLATLRRIATAATDVELTLPPAQEVPAVAGRDAAAYGAALDVARFDPWAEVGRLPLYYLLRDQLDALETILRTGTATVGVWRTRRDALVGSGAVVEAIAARLDARATLAGVFVQQWRRGRGRPLRSRDLASSAAVTERFRDEVVALATSLDGDGAALVTALRDGRVPNFRRGKADELEEELTQTGHVDPRPVLTAPEVLSNVLKRVVGEMRRGALDPEETRRLVQEYWGFAGGDAAAARGD